jgi:hypothetical protein
MGELQFQFGQKDDGTITNDTKLISGTEQSRWIPRTKLGGNESFICDYVKTVNEHKTSETSFEKHRSNALRRKYSFFYLFLNNHIDLLYSLL